MIEELTIKNGKLDLEFNKYNYTYTVGIEDDVSSLVFDYKLEDGYELSILDNKIDKDEGIVYLKSSNGNESYTYTLLVYKETAYQATMIDNYKDSLNVPKEEPTVSFVYIAAGCFLILLIIFVALFRKRKKI